ncbi:MAG: type II toxin-antitoxin system RelE/ParE family toxin [Ruminococcaceae bacterium]|nr:type II toxin-antitoxin system RelE/ParE family toxin [Oscillospiraceae bacterium]
MAYKIKLSKDAEKFLQKQPPKQQARIIDAILKLPYVGDITTMKGHSNLYRLRVGAYRIIYSVENDQLIVYVLEIGNRGDIYK